ncbi:PBSX family phage terminase large subunit [Arthrobacter citreus]|nr:PBSX family phage terminase large subunit [Arthrobacter citreus]
MKNIWMAGGRSSGKTNAACLKILLAMLSPVDPVLGPANCFVFQKNFAHIRKQSFSEMQRTISRCGFDTLFKISYSPLMITRVDTGSSIFFMGAETVQKVKGTAPAVGYVHTIWLEEADQFESMDEILVIRSTLSRFNPNDLTMILTNNPPKGWFSWANTEYERVKMEDPTWLTHFSTYLNLKKSWLSESQLEAIEHTKKANPSYFHWAYLGEITESGSAVFDMNFIKTTDESIFRKYEITMIELSCDPGFAGSACVVTAIAYLIPTGMNNPYRMTMQPGLRRYEPPINVLLDVYYFDPKVESIHPTSIFFADQFEKFANKLEKKYRARVNYTMTIDPAAADIRFHLNNFTKFSTILPNKSDKLKLIEATKSYLAQEQFYVLDIPQNKIFMQQMSAYSWKESEGQFSDIPKVNKVFDDVCDAFIYWVNTAERQHSIISNYQNYSIAKNSGNLL